jgi:7-keto-8-aminopelargonate synthetase-like enzyme
MAKSKHNNLLDTIGDLILHAKKEGLVHLYTEGDHFDGRHIQIKGQQLYHFGTTGYLGLEQDMRLKEAACDAIMRYGTQFPLSKTYVSFVIYKELEEALRQMYERPVVITKNSTLGHVGVIPSIVRDEDMMVLDQQVHASVQNAAQLLKPRNIPVQLVRHNDLNMLEDVLKQSHTRYRNIWYAADGVYSMYGDTVPVQELLELQKKYPQLHLYIDDVHGMSWAGKNGTGYVMSQLGALPERVVLVGTLSKSFGASGSVVAFGDEALYEKYRVFGGPQTFSAQLEPASVAAALASARIHLSDEIYEMQEDLQRKVSYCNQLIRQTNLPLIQENVCPVHFIGAAQPGVAYNFARRLMNEGFYINVATFPVVPVRNAGIRFTISRHNQPEEIKALVDAMCHHYPKAMEEEGMTIRRVRAAFKLPEPEQPEACEKGPQRLSVEVYDTIRDVDPQSWNQIFEDRGIMDSHSLQLLEQAFKNNERKDQNWDFVYLLIRDEFGKIVLATFFTVGLWKDDVLSKAEVSEALELIRQDDPYYMMSRVLAMGALITDGDHLHLDREHPLHMEALKQLCIETEALKVQYDAKMLMIRDIPGEDQLLNAFFHQQGFMKIDLPEGSELDLTTFENAEDYLQKRNAKSRKHIRKDILHFEDQFEVIVRNQLGQDELEKAYTLYLNVQKHNKALNNVTFPFSLMQQMNEGDDWEFLLFYLKQPGSPLVGIGCTHKGPETYQGVVLGMDYQYHAFKTYKQILYQVIMRAKKLNKKAVHLGLTANLEKRKLGSTLLPRVGFLQADTNYHLELLESLQGNAALPLPKTNIGG